MLETYTELLEFIKNDRYHVGDKSEVIQGKLNLLNTNIKDYRDNYLLLGIEQRSGQYGRQSAVQPGSQHGGGHREFRESYEPSYNDGMRSIMIHNSSGGFNGLSNGFSSFGKNSLTKFSPFASKVDELKASFEKRIDNIFKKYS